jgi:hypothetical protein
MSRWTTYLWQALAALGEADYPIAEHRAPRPEAVDLDDDTSVRAAFRSLMEWEFGPRSFEAGR